MPTRIIEQEPASNTVVQSGGSGFNSILLATFISLAVIAAVVLIILHATVGVL